MPVKLVEMEEAPGKILPQVELFPLLSGHPVPLQPALLDDVQ